MRPGIPPHPVPACGDWVRWPRKGARGTKGPALRVVPRAVAQLPRRRLSRRGAEIPDAIHLHLGQTGGKLGMMWLEREPRGWTMPMLAAFLGVSGWGAAADGGPLRVLTSFYPMYVHALNVGGNVDGVVVENLTEPMTGCLHDFQLTTGHMRRLADADILVINGGGAETFIEKVLRQRPDLKVVDASKGIEFICEGGHEGHHVGHDHQANIHVWVSPSLAMKQVDNIAEGLAALDPRRAAAYRSNAATYIGKLEALRARLSQELGFARGKRVVTFHEAFPYFARELGIEVAAVVQRDAGREPSPRELARTIDLVRRLGVAAVFAEPQYPASGAEAIQRETGLRFGLLDPVVTGPEAPAEAREAYLRAMDGNIRVLKRTLE